MTLPLLFLQKWRLLLLLIPALPLPLLVRLVLLLLLLLLLLLVLLLLLLLLPQYYHYDCNGRRLLLLASGATDRNQLAFKVASSAARGASRTSGSKSVCVTRTGKWHKGGKHRPIKGSRSPSHWNERHDNSSQKKQGLGRRHCC